MLSLQKITTEYIDKEDRIRLAGETTDGSSRVLWLTQRLLNRLIPPLCEWLEGKEPAGQQAAPLQQAQQQGLAQQKARTLQKPDKPVSVAQQPQQILVISVSLTGQSSQLKIIFKDDREQNQFALPLDLLPLRQWLNILLDQYQLAGWTTADWPRWMVEQPLSKEPAQSATVH